MGIIARIRDQPGERIAVRAGSSEISYARLLADLDAAAAAWRAEGLGSDSTVGIRAGSTNNGHCYANWVAHLAAIKIGAGHVSMTDPTSIRYVLQAGKIDCVIGSVEALLDVPQSTPRIQFHVDPAGPAPVVDGGPNDEASARRLNLTSGTTGKPKLVTWDAAMIEQRVDQIADPSLINSNTSLLPLLHLRTTAGFRYPLAVWSAGGCVLLPLVHKGLDRDREAILHANLVACSPPQLSVQLNGITDEWPGREGRTILVLGGRLPATAREAALKRACARLLVAYGSTETGGIAIGDHVVVDRHPGAVGFLRKGVEVEILDPSGALVAAGQPGLIRVRSAIMVSAYEEGLATSAASPFRDGWFYPGDIGRLYEDGLLAIDGRTGETLNLGGCKVSAPDLERRVAKLTGVKDVCAMAVQLPEGDRLTFGIVCADDIDMNALKERIQAMLAKRLRFYLFRMPSIPRNAMGKIPRALIASQLAALYSARKKNIANA